MKMQTTNCIAPVPVCARRGSTLIIVIALLGLLAFSGMIFFSFSSQERAAAEFFSESVKAGIDAPDNVWDHPLRHVISGPSNRPHEKYSIVGGKKRRISMVANLVGADLSPHSGEGINLIMEDDPATGDTTPVPRVDLNRNGTANDEDREELAGNDDDGDSRFGEHNSQPLLDFVDSPAARGGVEDRAEASPALDVDYTTPDINTLFIAYKGWAVRDNGTGVTPRYERVPVIIPSFMRPQYMKSGGGNGFGGNSTPTDIDWASSFDGINRPSAKFGGRSFRPHPSHVVVSAETGARAYRYLTNAEATTLGISSGGFPFVPADNLITQAGGGNNIRGEMGVWTGSNPLSYELDADNDGGAGADPGLTGDGTREGIWIDTHFPVQEFVDSSGTPKLYTVLHSFTIYDLDGLINLGIHGNLAGLNRSSDLKSIAGSGVLAQAPVSRSNLGLGPNEINPIWSIRGRMPGAFSSSVQEQFQHHFGKLPTNNLEQANMEWIWLLAGRANMQGGVLQDLFPGRWGEAERLYNAVKPGGTFVVADLPRPGRPGNAQELGSSGIRFGGSLTGNGRNGFDDNQDRLDGELNPGLGRVRAFGTPTDFAGTGRTHTGTVDPYTGSTFPLIGDIRFPLTHHDAATYGPERFLQFNGYSLMRDVDTTVARYFFGQNGLFDNGTGDDLIASPFLDPNFEDMMESNFDPDSTDRGVDQVLGPQDNIALHTTATDLSTSPDKINRRLKGISPFALDDGTAPFSFSEQTTPSLRSRFTTMSNSLHRFLMRSPFGADGKPGIAFVDDNGDGVIDNLSDLTAAGTTFIPGAANMDSDTPNRAWEFNADTDGNDTTGDGFPDGDGNLEFPPSFGTTDTDGRPFSLTDPFRAVVRRLMTVESGEGRSFAGQMPLSPNHILDVERNAQTPTEGTKEFYRYMLRAGMRFRPLTDHPLAVDALTITTPMPIWTAATPVVFPPTTATQREFWARRDRQKLARDIYVLLYTTGGAGLDGTTQQTLDYTADNAPGEPAAAEGTTLYTHTQLRRMAQFAVNLVDAMDSDNVMTKFEYDKNLGNGWNMDDDPYATAASGEGGPSTNSTVTGDGLFPEDGVERGVVWGVEAQELAISEAQGIHYDGPTSQHDAVPYGDDTQDRDFLYVELQNMRPTAATLGQTNSTTADTSVWRIARYDRDASKGAPTAVIGSSAAPDEEIAILQHPSNVIDGGGRFSISVASDAALASSSFFVDTGNPTTGMFDGNYELIAPDAGDVTLPTGNNVGPSTDPGYNPLTDIDVIHADHNGTNGAPRMEAPTGNFLENLVPYAGNTPFQTASGNTAYYAPDSSVGFDLVLHRRANPNMPQLDEVTENPWIEVDRIRVVFDNFVLSVTDTPATIFDDTMGPPAGLLMNISSIERDEPLDDTVQNPSVAKSATPYRKSTIKAAAAAVKSDLLGVNAASLPNPTLPAGMTNPANPYQLWQAHFDREYASAAEMLSLPLVGPGLLTQRLSRMRYPGYQQSFPDSLGTTGTQTTNLLSSGEAMLMFPDFTNSGQTMEIESSRDNRWYRLFQFVEVPSRVHRMLGNYISLQTIPGKININMIRHREVLAGLIDNPYLADVPALSDVREPDMEDGPFMTSASVLQDNGTETRDTFIDLLKDRDGLPVTSYDSVAGGSRLFWLPATPNANPFRSHGVTGSTGSSENGLNGTLMRTRQYDRNDGTVGTNRHWLELASPEFHQRPGDTDNNGTEDNISNNAMLRHQIISKIMNNTTTVSNCFIVYGTAAYFEVYEDPSTGLQRVGGRFDLDGDGDPLNDQQRKVFLIDRAQAYEAYDPGSGDFDWNSLIQGQATLQ